MSVAFFIVLDKEDPGFDTFVNGKALAHFEGLEKLTNELGLKEIYDFIGGGEEEFMEDFDPDEEMNDEIDPSKYSWFEPDEGIEYFAKLKSYFEENLESLPSASEIVEDLDEYLSVLKQTKAAGCKWHLQLDY